MERLAKIDISSINKLLPGRTITRIFPWSKCELLIEAPIKVGEKCKDAYFLLSMKEQNIFSFTPTLYMDHFFEVMEHPVYISNAK